MHVIGFDAYQTEGACKQLVENADLVISFKGQDKAARSSLQTRTQMWPFA